MTGGCAIFCKSFDEDFPRLRQLLESWQRLCPAMPFILSVPRADADKLASLGAVSNAVQVVFDEDYADIESVGPYGWYRQQVCKLSVHRTGLADCYLSVDSDSYLLRGITSDDFYAGDRKKIIHSSLFTKYEPGNASLIKYIQDLASSAPPAPAGGNLEGFGARLEAFRLQVAQGEAAPPLERQRCIHELFQIPPGAIQQPGQIFHASLLAGMETFFSGHGLTLPDLINLVPWEYNWYASWVASAAAHECCFAISPIVHFADEESLLHARHLGITEATLAARFKVITMAARHFDRLRY